MVDARSWFEEEHLALAIESLANSSNSMPRSRGLRPSRADTLTALLMEGRIRLKTLYIRSADGCWSEGS